MRRFLASLALAALVLPLAAAARASIVEDTAGPAEPKREFAQGFKSMLPIDKQAYSTLSKWNDPHVGGWGGTLTGDQPCPANHVARRPVVFIHGTTEDAWFWRAAETGDGTIVNVRDRFLAAGWCPEELWAISYTGAKGYLTYNDINADELTQFIDAVRIYTGSNMIDVVTHSLGVTVFRKAAYLNRYEYDHVAHLVALAGANHGTTTCQGVGTARGSEVCKELEPGSPWLAELNSLGETPAGPSYLVLYDPQGDQFYQGPDARSPRLAGACNIEMPLALHNALARGLAAVDRYRTFLTTGVTGTCTP